MIESDKPNIINRMNTLYNDSPDIQAQVAKLELAKTAFETSSAGKCKQRLADELAQAGAKLSNVIHENVVLPVHKELTAELTAILDSG